MKVRIQFKDPDAIYDGMHEAALAETKRIVEASGGMLDDEDLFDKVREKIDDRLGCFFEYGDYCTIELDTEAGTAVVLKKGG